MLTFQRNLLPPSTKETVEVDSTFPWNIGALVPNYTTLHLRRQESSLSLSWKHEISRLAHVLSYLSSSLRLNVRYTLLVQFFGAFEKEVRKSIISPVMSSRLPVRKEKNFGAISPLEFLRKFVGTFLFSLISKITDNSHWDRPTCSYVTSMLQVFLIDTGFVLAIYELRPKKHKNRVRSIVNFNVYDTLAFVGWVWVCKTRKRHSKYLHFHCFS